MPGSYFWAVALGALGIAAVAGAVLCSLLGMFRRQPDDPLPPYVGIAFALMVVGSGSFVGSLLLMVTSA